MIEDFLKNICLITFALIGPITLPAGGIQKTFNELKTLNNSKEIILNENCYLYSYPKIKANKLMIVESGSSLSILRKWKVNQNDIWLRVELVSNKIIESPNKTSKGWIKI